MIESTEVVEIINTLRKEMTLEEIAGEIGKSFQTVWSWSKGKRVPCKGDYELLKRMVKNEKPIV